MAQIIIVVLFFLSGATGLVYEVTWIRMFVNVFGNTTYAVSAVLTAFMGGLALGSLVIGRIADKKQNHLKLVALLEFGVGIFALLFPFILIWLTKVYEVIFQTFPDDLWLLLIIKTILSFIILIIPTFLMGGTLPLLSKFIIKRPEESGLKVSVLYALNTLGATIGCFLTGFYFIEYLGVLQTIQFAALVNLSIAGLFFILAILIKQKNVVVRSNEKESDNLRMAAKSKYHRIILTGFAIAGFAALSFEVLWSRLLVFKLNTTIYAFAIMLTTFLAGIGIGSLIFSILEKLHVIKNHLRTFAVLELLIGFYGLFSVLMFGMFEPLSTMWEPISWQEQMVQQLVFSGLIMLFPTILMGMAFPVVSRIYAIDISTIGGSIGNVYSANTFGTILGSFITGFILVELTGTQTSLIIISLLVFLIGTIFILLSVKSEWANKKLKRNALAIIGILWLMVILFIVLIPSDFLFQYYNIGEKEVNQGVEIVYAHEGTECITTVHRYPDGNRVLSTGSINVAGTDFTLRTTQKLQAHIPMLLHNNPKKVLQVGFGSGETSHIVTTYDIEALDVVEISEGVLETSEMYFRDINHNVINHPKFRAIIMDGANYVALSDRKYDIIMNDSIWPFYSGNSGLYTKEYFENGKKCLRAGGIMTSWLPVELPEESFKSLLKTFHSVFPHVSLWMAVTHYNKHALIVGSAEPLNINLDEFLNRFNKFSKEDLSIVKLDNPIFLLDAFKMDETTFNAWLEEAPLHTINKPVLEFAQRKKKPGIDREKAYELINMGSKPILAHLILKKITDNHFKNLQDSLLHTYTATKYLIKGIIEREKGSGNFLDNFYTALRYKSNHPGVRYLLKEYQQLKNIKESEIEAADFNRLLQLGERFLENNINDKAIKAFKRAAEINPSSALVHYNLGTSYYRKGELNHALQNLNLAVRLKSNYAQALNMRGLIYYAKNNKRQSINDFSRAIEINQDFTHAFNNRGIVLASNGEFYRALKDFNQAIHLNPDYSEAYFNRGLVFQSGYKMLALSEEEGIDKAISEYSKAISLDSVYINAYNNRGMLYAFKEKYQLAINDFTRVINLDSNQAEAYFNRALVFNMCGEFNKALGDLNKAIQLEPRYEQRLKQLTKSK